MLRVFWSLYVGLDEWSRKVLACWVSNTLGMEQGHGSIVYEKICNLLLFPK